MAALRPEPGLVLRYDFLFGEDHERGQVTGKDRPCAVVLVGEADDVGAHKVIVAPITHAPPRRQGDGVELLRNVARHLGLDDERMWVKVNELNRFTWDAGRLPFGVSPVSRDRQAYGLLPPRFYERVRDAVLKLGKARSVRITQRDD